MEQREVSRRAVVASGLGLAAVAAGAGAFTARRSRESPDTVTALDSTAPSEAPSARSSISAGGSATAAALAAAPTRSASPTLVPAPLRPRPVAGFDTAAEEYLDDRPGSAGVAAVNLTTGAWVEHRPTGAFPTASIVKLEILIGLLLQLGDDGREPSSAQQRRARQMITASDNDAADDLWSDLGGGPGLARTGKRLGLTDTVPGSADYWGATRTTPRDQLRVVRALVDPGPLRPPHCEYVRSLLLDVAPEQRWGVSAAGDEASCELKNGWLPAKSDGGLWVLNSIGRVTLPNRDVVLMAVLSRGSPSMGAGIATVERLVRMAGEALVRR